MYQIKLLFGLILVFIYKPIFKKGKKLFICSAPNRPSSQVVLPVANDAYNILITAFQVSETWHQNYYLSIDYNKIFTSYDAVSLFHSLFVLNFIK